MPQEDNSLNDLIQKLLSTTNSDNSKFVDELDVIKSNILNAINNATQGGKLSGLNINQDIGLSQIIGESTNVDSLNVVLGLKFLKVKRNILKAIDTETQGGKLPGLNIDDKISLSDILGESPNLNMFHALQWLRIKKNILKKVEKATEDVELEIDNKLSLNDILGSTPKQDIITSLRFFMIRQGLLKKIAKAAKDFDPQESIDSITKGAGGRSRSITRSTSGRSRRPLVRSKSDTGSRTGDKIAGVGKGVGGAMAGIGKGAGEGISGFLKGLGRGLKAISNPKYLIGAGVLIALGGALFITGKALQTFVDIDWKSVLYGLATLTALGIGAALLANIGPMILIGALAIAALGAALIPAGIAFGMFSDIDWKGVGIGIGVLTTLGVAAAGLSLISPAIFIGAAAIAALGAALIPASTAFGMFSDIDWKGVGIGIGVLTTLGVAAAGLSLISPAIFVGALAIAALGAAMIPAAYAFDLFSRSLEGISTLMPILQEFVGTVIEGLIGLSSGGPGLLIAGAGILAVTAALIAFGASSAIAGLLSFFGGDPIEKFLELADKATGLSAAAKAIDTIASALKKLDSDKVDDVGDALKGVVKQLKNLSKLDLGQAAELFSFFGGASIGSGSVRTPSVGGVYEEKTEKEAMSAARESGLYNLDKLGNSEIDRDKVKGASKAQLRAIVNHDDLSDEDMEFVQAALAKKRAPAAAPKPQLAVSAMGGTDQEGLRQLRTEGAEAFNARADDRNAAKKPQPTALAMGGTSTKAQGIYSQIEGASSTAAGNMMSGEGLNRQIEQNLVRALSRSDSSTSARFGKKRLDGLKAQAESGEISPEKLENIIANLLITATEKSGKTSKGDITDLRAIHKENVLNGRQLAVETNNVSSGAEMLSQSTHIANMKANQSKQIEETTTAVVDNSSRSSINNTTINEAPKHIDRTFQVFAYA